MNAAAAKIVIILTSIAAASISRGQESDFSRPPQYIMISFDGSYGNAMWQETRNFGIKSNSQFTHFVSGVDFLVGSSSGPVPGETKSIYKAPKATGLCSAKNPKCTSDIGFGGTVSMLKERVLQVSKSLMAGMEIANHGNSHFDGSTWTEKEWTFEFNWFHKLLAQVFSINKIQGDNLLPQENEWKEEILGQLQGFRAPYLATNESLWDSMAKSDWKVDSAPTSIQYKYDASQVTDQLSKWPEKSKKGLWEFKLVQLPVPGRTKKIISMDYNFYASQSKALPDFANAGIYEEQMFQAYANWFLRNYHGNRAPINIGHHFSTWNNGAYWKALQRFSLAVCSLPEVRCVTYNQMVDALENKNLASRVAQLNLNKFDQSNRPQFEIPMKSLVSSGSDSSEIKGAVLDGRFAVNLGEKSYWSINGNKQPGKVDLIQAAKAGVTHIELLTADSKHKILLYIDWNPTSDTVKLRKLEDDKNATCPAESHREVETRQTYF